MINLNKCTFCFTIAFTSGLRLVVTLVKKNGRQTVCIWLPEIVLSKHLIKWKAIWNTKSIFLAQQTISRKNVKQKIIQKCRCIHHTSRNWPHGIFHLLVTRLVGNNTSWAIKISSVCHSLLLVGCVSLGIRLL